MKKPILYFLWGFFYLLCAFISNVESPTAVQSGAMLVLSLLFFVPPGLLLYDALKKKDKKQLRLLRLFSFLSLSLTLVALIANFGSVKAVDTVGIVLHQVLIFASVPMMCSRQYALSMFLWACLLILSTPKFWQRK